MSLWTEGYSCSSLDELRYKLATTTDKAAHALPPTDDAFQQHVLHARYQTAILCHSHKPAPSRIDHGWVTSEDGQLEAKMYLKDSAPIKVWYVTHMYCTDKDCSQPGKCQCLKSGLPCIYSCSCNNNEYLCPNIQVDVSEGN